MPRKHYSPEEIIKLLRLVEIEAGRGMNTAPGPQGRKVNRNYG
jgi:hypothetical protein